MIIELIPYNSFKQRIGIVSNELKKNRYIEVWEDYIYSATKREKRYEGN